MTATLNIQTASANGSTFLKECYCTTPFKVADITENKKAGILRLMLMSASPGILDGDDYNINIQVAENCSLQLLTQAYQRLFTMKQQAMQKIEVSVEANASFCFIPHPVVPHRLSNFSSKNKIFLSQGCSLIFSEIVTCGRKLNGEVFLFSKYHSVTEIFIEGKLVVKENLLLQPALINVKAIGQLQQYTHQASLIYLNENADVKKIIPMIIDLLSTQKNISMGVTIASCKWIDRKDTGSKSGTII